MDKRTDSNVQCHTDELLDDVDPYLDMGSHEREPVPAARTRGRYRLHLWALEFLALGISAGIMVALFLFLAKYNNRVIPDWRLSINTIVSILTNILRAAVLFSVANVIGQAKVSSYIALKYLSRLEDLTGSGWEGTISCCTHFINLGLRANALEL